MNYRVVLADDEPEVLRSIQRTLDWEKYGFSVVGAFLNGLDVLEFLENHDVDIVFTDIRMPFMDGIELMHKIKEKYPYIKLVIISGYDDFQYAKEALIHGVLDYILKPINAREMSEVIQKVKDKMDTELEEKQSIRLNANQGRERENKAKGIIEEAKQKIQEEFGDPDIGLEKIAAEVGLTQTYFSSLFKKETGMSFVEYLTDTRMKEAMRLLKETSEKIYVVAQKVGYLESGYFSHVFKKKYGMSPIQCRRQGQ